MDRMKTGGDSIQPSSSPCSVKRPEQNYFPELSLGILDGKQLLQQDIAKDIVLLSYNSHFLEWSVEEISHRNFSNFQESFWFFFWVLNLFFFLSFEGHGLCLSLHQPLGKPGVDSVGPCREYLRNFWDKSWIVNIKSGIQVSFLSHFPFTLIFTLFFKMNIKLI